MDFVAPFPPGAKKTKNKNKNESLDKSLQGTCSVLARPSRSGWMCHVFPLTKQAWWLKVTCCKSATPPHSRNRRALLFPTNKPGRCRSRALNQQRRVMALMCPGTGFVCFAGFLQHQNTRSFSPSLFCRPGKEGGVRPGKEGGKVLMRNERRKA